MSTLDSTITAALIGLIGIVLGALLSTYRPFDHLLHRKIVPNITGPWESVWIDVDGTSKAKHFERVEITGQRGTEISGSITVQEEPERRWDFKGRFNGRYLQMIYFPSATDERQQDNGCYLFEIEPGGSFRGYSVGLDWDRKSLGVSEHYLRRNH